MQISPKEASMLVQFYPPHNPCNRPMAFEDTLRRAYPTPEAPPPDRLDTLLRRMMEKARRMERRLM